MHPWFRDNGLSSAIVVLLAIAVTVALGTASEDDAVRAGRVEHASDVDFHQVVLAADIPVLVEFYADSCGPCRRLEPVINELAREMSGAKIVKVNVDQSPQLAAIYGVTSVPTLKVFKQGGVVAQHVGTASREFLRNLVGD